MNLLKTNDDVNRDSAIRRHLADSLESARIEILMAQNAHDDLIRALSIVHATRHLGNARDALDAAIKNECA
jgi:hypothetical protein